MPPDPPREQGPPGLATPTQINATPTSKTVENPDLYNVIVIIDHNNNAGINVKMEGRGGRGYGQRCSI